MRDVISNFPDFYGLSMEELKELRSSFYVPFFCKFFLDLKRVDYIRKSLPPSPPPIEGGGAKRGKPFIERRN